MSYLINYLNFGIFEIFPYGLGGETLFVNIFYTTIGSVIGYIIFGYISNNKPRIGLFHNCLYIMFIISIIITYLKHI